MKEIIKRGATSNILRVFLQDSTSTTGAGKTALTSTSTGLIISTIADNEATATTYTAAATNVETVTTLGTFAVPTASKCRFREVDATNFPGVYEIHIADARFAVANSTQLLISIQCTGVAPVFVEYQLVAVDLMDTVRFGLTAIPNVAQGTTGAISTGNATGQVTVAATATGALTSTSFAANSLTASALATDAVTEITGGVWDEAYAGHTTAGTFGKLMDILRKSNYVTEGTVSASGSPANSTTYFRSSLTGADNFYTSQTLLFVSGTLAGQAMNIETFTSTNGVVTSSDPLTATPTSGDAFVVLGEHVWSRAQIADAVLTRSLTTAGAANNIAITSIVSNVFQAVNTLAVDDRVTFVGTAPLSLTLGAIYWVISGSLTSTTFTLSTTQGGLGVATSSTGAFTATKVSGRDMLSALRYLRNKVDISGSTMTVYQEDDTSAAWNSALTTTAGLNPVTSSDPS